MKTEPNDQAFPVVAPGFAPEGGLTKREKFAESAMKGMLANNSFRMSDQEYGYHSVLLADALIEALNRVCETKDGE